MKCKCVCDVVVPILRTDNKAKLDTADETRQRGVSRMCGLVLAGFAVV